MVSSRFDQHIDRNAYPTMKWNPVQLREHFGSDAVLPFWVADMDFPAPDAVIDSLVNRAKHGIYGYEYKREGYFDALVNWYADRHNWHIDLEHVEACPSVLSAITILMNQHSDEGDGVIIQPPVFFEFNMVIKSNHRQRIKNPLIYEDGSYQMDFDDLEAKAADPRNKILILCNPHNPVGRVWTKKELTRVGEICQQHNVLVISDEIHGDIVYGPHRFTPILSISEDLAQNAVACLSPAKSFNIPGLVDAFAVIPKAAYREQFHDFAHRYQINKTNVFASAAIEAAYSAGADWLDDLLAYLQGNIDFLESYLADELPRIELVEPEGTYLVWLNLEALEMDAKDLERFLADDAQLALNSGHWFGREGAGFARMNIACPRVILKDALLRLTKAVQGRLLP
jgi:cystathionine beta-lyase